MATSNVPAAPRFQMPLDVDAVGPQNDAERRLFDLILEGIHSDPSDEITIEQLSAELRARLSSKR